MNNCEGSHSEGTLYRPLDTFNYAVPPLRLVRSSDSDMERKAFSTSQLGETLGGPLQRREQYVLYCSICMKL
jgi:hypothetical protein